MRTVRSEGRRIGLREWLQTRAVNKMRDERRLLKIWRRSPYFYVRNDAIHKIWNQQSLEVIAQIESDGSLRCEAVKKLTNGVLLRRIAREDPDSFVRFIAQKRVECGCDEPWDVSALTDSQTTRQILEYLELNS